jgi:hypothetical protein
VLSVAVSLIVAACSGANPDAAAPTSAAFGQGSTTTTVTGTTSALSGSCPTVTFLLEQKTIKSSASTTFGDATCASLKNALRVEIVGTVQTDGTIAAASVRLIPTTSVPTPTPPPTTVSIVGGVNALGGACPSITFTLEARTIVTNASTIFGNGLCADVKNAIRVEIVGTVQTDGRVLASKVGIVITTPPAPTPTSIVISGLIATISGSCPSLTLRVADRTVTTSSNTLFDGKACADLAVGSAVEITGVVSTTSTVIVATKVAPRK